MTFHGLLMLIFLFGSAFLPKKTNKENDLPPVVTFERMTDLPVSSGGNPNANPENKPKIEEVKQPVPVKPVEPPPVVKPVEPPPVVKPEKVVEPPKPKEVVRHTEPEHKPEPKHDGDEPAPLTKKDTKPKNNRTNDIAARVSTKVIKRTGPDVATLKAQKEAQERADREAREYAAYQQHLKDAVGRVGNTVGRLGTGLKGGVASGVDVFGPGGGVAVSNWRAAVKEWLQQAWNPPTEADDSLMVRVTVTIARDGSILSYRILTNSGEAEMDRSIQRLFRDVRSVPAFPEGAKEDQRVLTINFNVKAKRGLG